MKYSLKSIATLFIIMILATTSFAQLSFIESVQTPDTSGYVYSIGDLNNDGYPDMYISTKNDQTDKSGNIWQNNGQGIFTKGQSIGRKGMTQCVAFADLNNDGDLDMFLANDATYSNNPEPAYLVGCPNEVWFNDGKGNFTNSGQLLEYEPSLAVKLVDLDNDGDIDAIVTNYHEAIAPYLKFKPDEVWFNDGKGIFALGQTMGYGMGGAEVIDIDKDGDWDVLDNDTLWFNDGKGKFTKSSKIVGNGGRRTIEFGDLNGDGNVDAFITVWNAPAEVWLNDGSSNFTDSKQKLGNLQCNNVQLIDIDGDGDLDAFTDNSAGSCKLWINQGGKQNGKVGTFMDTGLTLPSGRGILCDFNKDGKMDALIGNKIWINEYEETSIKGGDDPTDGKHIPDEIKLNQNYPNPFNPSTTIQYALNKSSQIRLIIYNLLGKKIRLLQNAFQNAGEHSLVWDAMDDKNNPVGSGIHFYRLQTDESDLQKKMVLVR
jgi:hypothetical protein